MKSTNMAQHSPFPFEEMLPEMWRQKTHDASIGKEHIVHSQQVSLTFIFFVFKFQLLQWDNLSTTGLVILW